MATSCALQCMFHNLRKQQLWVQTRLSVPASFRSRRMAPTLLCLETRERERGRVGVQGVCSLTVSHTAVEGSHLLCPLPAFHTASVPDWSATPEPAATSSLPPHTHTPKAACFAASYAKEFFTCVSQLRSLSYSCKSVREATHFCFLDVSFSLKSAYFCFTICVNKPKSGSVHCLTPACITRPFKFAD